MTRAEFKGLLARASAPWLAAMCLVILFIWGNSLVPGEGSGTVSLSVVDAVRGLLDAAGLPSAWVTNLLVRKAAHFSEYASLGVVAVRAWRPYLPAAPTCRLAQVVATAAVLALVPVADECIQLLVPGRCGSVCDVALDWCGALCGALAAYAASCAGHVKKYSD